MKLYIKNMVSFRCIMLVKEELHQLGLENVLVELGVVEIAEDFTPDQREQLKTNLLRSKLELIDDKKNILVERIKHAVIAMIYHSDDMPATNYSKYLSEKLNYDYTYLSNIFTDVKRMTVQHFIILHKIERVKELLNYDELTLSEIAHKLHYSSVSHLSKQFHKVTGLSPSDYKLLKQKHRNNLENV